MRPFLLAGTVFLGLTFVLLAASRPIQPGDITKATEIYLRYGQKDEHLKKYVVPIYQAAETVMSRQLPGAEKLSVELAHSLEKLYENRSAKLPYIAAKAFMSRPDLFDSAFKSIDPDKRPRAVAKLFYGWLQLRSELERNPVVQRSTKVRMKAFNNIIGAWTYRYPQALPSSLRREAGVLEMTEPRQSIAASEQPPYEPAGAEE